MNHIIKVSMLFLLLTSMFGIALSHNGEEDGHPNEIQENHYSTINPMY